MELQKINFCDCGDCDPTNVECVAYNEQLHFEITTRQFRHKTTGKVETQINILEMGDYEEV